MKKIGKTDEILEIIASTLNVSDRDINTISVVKKGMTNHSILFTCNKQTYIMRIPGEGTSKLINRNQEYNVYSAVKDISICDEIVYINPQNGYKIARFWSEARTCNPDNREEVRKCMKKNS